jgi:high-affinity nickel-transport protein
MIFPILFTAGMCLIDTTDGGLMLTLYTWHDDDDVDVKGSENSRVRLTSDLPADALHGDQGDLESGTPDTARDDIKISKDDDLANELPASEMNNSTSIAETPALQPRKRQQDPLIFLYYSTILTGVTVIVALVIGTIQLLSLILDVAEPTGKFWDGVATASEHFSEIGGSICVLFLIVGVSAIFFYGRFKRWVYATRERNLALKDALQEAGRDGEVVQVAEVERTVSAEVPAKKVLSDDGQDNHELLYRDSSR